MFDLIFEKGKLKFHLENFLKTFLRAQVPFDLGYKQKPTVEKVIFSVRSNMKSFELRIRS